MIWLEAATWRNVVWLFQFRNMPEMYKWGQTPRPVTWNEHRVWFNGVLNNPDEHQIFIVMLDDAAIGMVRFERDRWNDAARISVGILPWHASKHAGRDAIKIASQLIAKRWGVPSVTADILQGNEPSERAFKAAGFEHIAGIVGGGRHYQWSANA